MSAVPIQAIRESGRLRPLHSGSWFAKRASFPGGSPPPFRRTL